MLNTNSSNQSSFTHKFSASTNQVNGFSAQPVPAVKKIIRKKSPVSFERRFLSEKSPEGKGNLEVAMLWRGDVVNLQSFDDHDNCNITIGNCTAGKDRVTFGIDDERIGFCKTLLSCINHKWYLNFEHDYDGFLVVDFDRFGTEKVMLSDCMPDDKKGIRVAANNKNALCIQIDGMTRAAVKFGDVLLLVHLAKPVEVLPISGFQFNRGVFSSVALSFFIHLVVFSTIMFATDRVSALNVDYMMTSSRFAQALVQPMEVDEPVAKDVDEEPVVEDPDDVDDVIVTNSSFAPSFSGASDGGSGSGSSGMSRSQAVAAASSHGLLSQANTMNSMLAMGANLDNMNLDYTVFDVSAAASESGCGASYCLMANTGVYEGSSSRYEGNGLMPGSSRAISEASRSARTTHLGPEKTESIPHVAPGKVDVSGGHDARTIQKIVRQHTGEIKACYERELVKVKGLNGKITMQWFISPDGSVMKVFVKETTMHNKAVESCLTNSIQHWRFASLKGGSMSSIVYPFTFTAGLTD